MIPSHFMNITITTMKNKVLLLFSLFIALGMFSCSDYLDVQPDNSAVLDSKEKIKQLLSAAYNLGDYYTFCETMSDNVGDEGKPLDFLSVNIMTAAWQWAEKYNADATEQGSPAFYWSQAYLAIAQANHALEYIAGLPVEKQKDYLPFKGEALLVRAYNHFMLVNLFAKHYNPTTAATDPGIPYVAEAEKELIKTYTRGTVQAVYDNVEKDLLEGLPLINDEVYDVPKFHFNKKAAHAFAVRYYLFKGNFDKVIYYANLLYPIGTSMTSQLRDYVAYGSLGVFDKMSAYGSYRENANLLIADAISWWGTNYYTTRYGLSKKAFKSEFGFLRESSPTRSGRSFAYDVYGGNGQILYLLPKFRQVFEVTDFQAQTGLGHLNMPLLTAEEVLFSRAEAHIMRSDSVSALRDLNAFYKARILVGNEPEELEISNDPDDTASMQSVDDFYNSPGNSRISNTFSPRYPLPSDSRLQNLLKAVIDARRMEFTHEGLRWFDIRRFNIVVEHFDFNALSGMKLEVNDPRQQLQIPEQALTSGLEKNPR